MITFALILILTIGGQSQTFAMDSGLTIEDCQATLKANAALAETGKLQCVAETKGPAQ